MPHPDAQLAAGMAIGSILSLLMLSAVLLRKCCIGRRHHKHAKVLLVGTAARGDGCEGGALPTSTQ